MNPLEKIDAILNFLKDRSDLSASFSKEYIWNLYVSKTPELDINRQVYEEILKKLVEDGYVREENEKNFQSVYHLTMKGLLFEGYLNNQKENQKLLQTATSLSNGIFWLTTVIAIGSGAAAVYYIFEILNHFYCIYPK